MANSIQEKGGGCRVRSKAADSRSASVGIRRFESGPPHYLHFISKCGNIKHDLKLSNRTYNCDKCGLIMNRDLNAAINIRNIGMIKVGRGIPELTPVESASAERDSQKEVYELSLYESGTSNPSGWRGCQNDLSFEIFRSGVKMGLKENNFFTNLFNNYEIPPFNKVSSLSASSIQEKLDRLDQNVNVLEVMITGICLGHGISKIATKDKDFDIIVKVEHLEIMDEL